MRRVRRVKGQRTDSADQEYINYRLPANGEGNTVVEPTLLDGLSFPLTFLWATFKVSTCGRRAGRSGGLTDQIKVGLRAALPALATDRRLTVVVMGGSERAEERLLLQTTYLQEISAYFPGVAVHLVLSGPEMSKAGHKATKAWSGLRVTRFRGTAGDVMRELPEAFEGPCVAVGFNTGFGSGDARLVASWKGDLRRLQDRGVPVVFTCANDYNDLRKETKILQEGFQFDYLLKPTPSPFKALTTYHLPGEQDTSWTCANSWTYVVVGRANVVRGAGAGAAGPRPRPAAPEAAHPAGKIADLDLDAMD